MPLIEEPSIKHLFLIFFFSSILSATVLQEALNKAVAEKLYEQRYWKLLLHYNNDKSEIDDSSFFLSPKGRTSPKAELIATLRSLYNEKSFDDNATACRYPARTRWLQERLHLSNLPKVDCREYKKIFDRVDPHSATLVFPSAHINSPASMFGHTFIRINSSYHSKLLAYAINYAADADQNKENGIVFAFKGLFGGYAGRYSLLPYYDKLKEYRDTENRDIWEYDLNLTKKETIRMFEHIWEIKNVYSSYYFFTDNCSYEMLWLIEVARPSIHLREHFFFDVIPLESVYAAKEEGVVQNTHYRPSKHSIIEAYKSVLPLSAIQFAKQLAKAKKDPKKLLHSHYSDDIKRYTLEVAIELTQYYYQKKEFDKERYLTTFHTLTSMRAKLGKTKKIKPKEPYDPLGGHRARRATLGMQAIDGKGAVYFGIRPAYHSLSDTLYGYLRGTQIEFLDFSFYATKERLFLDKATILSVESIAQIDSFFNNFSWRMNLGWNRDYLDTESRLNFSVGFGGSFGNDFGYIYALADPLLYKSNKFVTGIGVSGGFVIDSYQKIGNTKAEYTHRWYDNAKEQNIVSLIQTFRIKQNLALKLSYDYRQRNEHQKNSSENLYSLKFGYYF